MLTGRGGRLPLPGVWAWPQAPGDDEIHTKRWLGRCWRARDLDKSLPLSGLSLPFRKVGVRTSGLFYLQGHCKDEMFAVGNLTMLFPILGFPHLQGAEISLCVVLYVHVYSTYVSVRVLRVTHLSVRVHVCSLGFNYHRAPTALHRATPTGSACVGIPAPLLA